MSDSKHDIIFVYGFCRTNSYLLNLIKSLATNYRVGLLYTDPVQSRKALSKTNLKLRETESLFVKFAESLGAEILSIENLQRCRLLVMPQFYFEPEYFRRLKKQIQYDKVLVIASLGSGAGGLEPLKDMGAKKLFVQSRQVFYSRLKHEKSESMIRDWMVEEVGVPYAKHPIFESLEMDYLVALPSNMFMKNPKTMSFFYRNLFRLLKSIPQGSNIFIKLHNARESLGSSSRMKRVFFQHEERMFSFIETLGRVTRINKFFNLSGGLIREAILNSYQPLSAISKYFNFGIELFLPHAKKGLITGVSTCSYYALYNRLPVFNCDEQPVHEGMPNYFNYRHFIPPTCHDRLQFDKKSFDLIPDSSRNADLLEKVKMEIP